MSTARNLWAAVTGNPEAAFATVGPQLLVTVSAAQVGAATAGGAYVSTTLQELGIEAAMSATVNPRAFAGVASDGRDLADLLYQPFYSAGQQIAAGVDVPVALEDAGKRLDRIVQTQVQDAGRTAAGVAIASTPAATGWTRMVNPPVCSRCVILAGRFYRWSDGFARHPRCDCRHIPGNRDVATDHTTDPRQYFDALERGEILDHTGQPVTAERVFGVAGAEAIRRGADIGQVVNARRGMNTAASGRLVRDKSGHYSTRSGARRGRTRLMPESIFEIAGDDRDLALQLLKRHGYVTPTSLSTARPAGLTVTRTGPLTSSVTHRQLPRVQAPSDLSDDALVDRLTAAFADEDFDLADRLTVELDRRDAERARRQAAAERSRAYRARKSDEQSAEIGDLIGQGWDPHEAVAQVTGRSVESQRRAEVLADARANGIPARSFDDATRVMFRRQVSEWYVEAEAATNGYLLNREGIAKGIDPASLFTGTDARARRYASDELRQWWDDHGGRTQLSDYRAQLLGGTGVQWRGYYTQ